MSEFRLEKVSGPMSCGEGPHWDSERECLYFVDIMRSSIFRYIPVTNELYAAKVDAPYISFILPVKGTEDKFLVGAGLSIAIVTWDGLSTEIPRSKLEILYSVEPDRPRNRFNDGKTDARGRVFAGTMGSQISGVWEQKRGALYSFGKERKLKTNVEGIGIANGLAWTEDNRTFYYADSLAYTVDAFDYDITTGQTSNRRVIFDLKKNNIEGIADGMTIDTNGNLWIALYGGSSVIAVNPNNGTVIRKVSIPGRDITSVAFGGDNLDELYVTSADQDLPDGEAALNREAGCTFRITGLGVTGYPGVPAVI